MFIIILYKFNQNKLYTFRYISFIIDYFKLTVIICNKIYYIILCQYKVYHKYFKYYFNKFNIKSSVSLSVLYVF